MTNTAVADLNKVQYAGLDFPTLFDDLRSELQIKFAADFNDFALSSLAIMLVDITAYGLDSLAFYLDRRATDSYLATAQTRKAVARLTRQLGYKMGGAISASTDLTVRITNPVNFTVSLPKGYQFLGPNGLVFESGEAVSFPPLSTTALTIPVYEGQTFTETFVGDGTANQVFLLARVPSGKSVVQNSPIVYVNGVLYEEVDFLPITGGRYFEIGYNDEPATIRFGDGTVSQSDIPSTGSTISITYVAATGLAGQVSSNTITKTVSPLVVNLQTVQLSITNPEGAVGGDDPESLERAKYLAGKVYKSRRVAVTQSDYVALANAFADPLFGRVAVAQAFSSRSAESDLELQNLLQDVRDVTTPVQGEVATQVTSLDSQTSQIDSNVGDITSSLALIASSNTTADSALGTATNLAIDVGNRAVLGQGRATSGSSTIATIPVGASDELTSTTQSQLIALFAAIGTDFGTILSTTNSLSDEVASAQDEIEKVGTTVVGTGYLSAVNDSNTLISAASSTISGTISPAILAAVEPLSATGTGTESINAALDAIETHVDAFLAANCQANLVTVPILTRDANGFYAAPSLGLKQRLQTYLDERKGVTQTVQVTSGELSLRYAILVVQVGVRQGYSESVVRTACVGALDGLLKNRLFGASLYRSTITDTLLEVDGVAFVNPTISGYYTADSPSTIQTSQLDSYGNLIIDDSQVITKQSVVVTTVQYTEPL